MIKRIVKYVISPVKHVHLLKFVINVKTLFIFQAKTHVLINVKQMNLKITKSLKFVLNVRIIVKLAQI